ncbi:hypothetical protein JOB18_038747 [Solea senegalensis]|uniref:Immunoglobulin V-set domain-containing protein n=2 Tax=Solea senegalensis TaxID=28829 RepID=A0AAV6RJT6_SOLSE|nr:hypothetical protein JOB18_038747 [Solea senegalensis]
MKTDLLFTFLFIQLSKACAEVLFRSLMENQSMELSCSLQRNLGSLTHLHLYHRGVQHQITLLSMADGGEVRLSPDHRGRMQFRGGLHSLHVNVTISHLEHSDTGLYMWELSYREMDNTDLIHSDTKVFLLVEGTGT